MIQIVLVIPAAMQGVILTDVFTLTKLYHATQSATHCLVIGQFAAVHVRSAGVAAKMGSHAEVESFHR
jgi:hypothetical protein